MALREFTDEEGIRWRAWDILPGQLHPSTRVEDFMQGFLDGWIAFESIDGTRRARLTPVPRRWAEGSEDDLRELLAQAERPGKGGGARSTPPDSVATPARHAGDREIDAWSGVSWPRLDARIGGRGHSAPPGTMRTFRYPGGRFWSVYEQALGERVVLRFSSGTRSLDLLAWPPRWFEHPDEELIELLARAFPRRSSDPPSGSAGRRRGDQPEMR